MVITHFTNDHTGIWQVTQLAELDPAVGVWVHGLNLQATLRPESELDHRDLEVTTHLTFQPRENDVTGLSFPICRMGQEHLPMIM